jgi:PAS domain S-box-containing protein
MSANFPVAEMLDSLIQQITEQAIILLDARGVVQAWLAGSEQIFGYSASEVVGKSFVMLFTPEDRAKQEPEKELSIGDAGTAAEDDRWMLRKDGSRFWVTGFLQAIRDDRGKVIGYGKLLRNRTDLKSRLESAERRVESLQQADERKNRFISTLSHELRNPLQSLTTASDILERIVQPGDDGTFVMALVHRQLDSMRRMVDDLLDVTRMSTGKMKLQLTELVLNDVIQAATASCQSTIDERRHSVHLLLGEVPIYVKGDEQRLQQVFVNLIENAAKYTECGGEIWIKLTVEGDQAVAKVEDNGIGISSELLPEIFEIFTQAEITDASKPGGLGIGLSVVKEITQLHGGSVQVRSDGVGKGSDFSVRLPLASRENGRPDSPGAQFTRI